MRAEVENKELAPFHKFLPIGIRSVIHHARHRRTHPSYQLCGRHQYDLAPHSRFAIRRGSRGAEEVGRESAGRRYPVFARASVADGTADAAISVCAQTLLRGIIYLANHQIKEPRSSANDKQADSGSGSMSCYATVADQKPHTWIHGLCLAKNLSTASLNACGFSRAEPCPAFGMVARSAFGSRHASSSLTSL